MNKKILRGHTTLERMVKMEILQKVCLVFTIVGAINWGLIGFLDFNLVEAIFMQGSAMVKIIYSLVGITGLINIGILFHHIDDHPFEK